MSRYTPLSAAEIDSMLARVPNISHAEREELRVVANAALNATGAEKDRFVATLVARCQELRARTSAPPRRTTAPTLSKAEAKAAKRARQAAKAAAAGLSVAEWKARKKASQASASLSPEELHYAKVMKIDPAKLAAHKSAEAAAARAGISVGEYLARQARAL